MKIGVDKGGYLYWAGKGLEKSSELAYTLCK
jgi:hypothetical protein